MKAFMALGAAALAVLGAQPAAAQEVITTPEGAIMESGASLAYAPGELTEAQLNGNARHLFRQDSANVFRRFPRELTEAMVNFYVGALGLRSLNPIQLTATQQMILTGVGTGQIKLSAGQEGNRVYDLSGGYAGGTGIRFLVLSYPDADVVAARFAKAGFAAPQFTAREDGTAQALVRDPAGMDIVIVVNPDAADHSDDGVGVGIQVSDLDASRAFYRDFVGLDELDPVESTLLGTTLYPYAHAETTILLYKMGDNLPADTGSSGIQYVVADAPYVAAMADHRSVTVETPLNRLRGFDLTTIWLNDPDGVTNYFAQVGPDSRTARGEN